MGILNIKNLVNHFVTERIIDINEKETINVDTLLRNIGSDLENGINSTFHKMLDIMKNFGNLAAGQLAENIKRECSYQVSIIPKGETVAVNFTATDTVDDMFTTLVCTLRSILSEDKFQLVCLGFITIKKKLPKSFFDEICATKNFDELFRVVVDSPYCNWMNIRLLKQIALASLQVNARKLIEQYINAVFSKKLKDVIEHISEIQVTEGYYTKAKEKWKKEFEDVTLKDVFKEWDKLERIFGTEEPAMLLERAFEGSVEFHWLIPAELVCHARYSAFRNWHQLHDILYLDICDHVIKDSRYEFSTGNSNTGTYVTLYMLCVCCVCVCVGGCVCV